MDLVAWQCAETLGAVTCEGLGLPPKPGPKKLTYSFNLVFDVGNPNPSLPIPLVEALVGMNVFDTSNLGTACIRFCDPDDETCEPAINPEGACEVDDARNVKGPEDLVPTVDDLIDLARDEVTGQAGDNGDWRVIPGGESVEAHIQFDMSADVMLSLANLLIEDALNDVLDGRTVRVEVPYTTEGTLFFDAPRLGRYATGFGPWEDQWVLQ